MESRAHAVSSPTASLRPVGAMFVGALGPSPQEIPVIARATPMRERVRRTLDGLGFWGRYRRGSVSVPTATRITRMRRIQPERSGWIRLIRVIRVAVGFETPLPLNERI